MLHFVSGLPRSGSTLLCNLLSQNPRLHVTATSGLPDLIFGIRTQWNQVKELRRDGDAALSRVMGAVLSSFHGADRPVILDKSRGWVAEIELLESVLGRPVKIIAPVRDVRDVLASFEKLYRRNIYRGKAIDPAEYLQCQTVEGRCQFWLGTTSPLGIAYGRLVDALHRGYADRLHFVHFERLTAEPEAQMRAIYDFLGEEWHPHDFERVEQVTQDDDSLYGWGDLHTIRPRVEPAVPQWPSVLGEFARDFGRLNFT